MTHSDDNGLVLPPRIAPLHIDILPMIHKEEQRADIIDYCEKLAAQLRQKHFDERPLQVEIDTRQLAGGEKAWSWVKKGVPIRVEVGAKELQNNAVFVGRRDKEYKDRISMTRSLFIDNVVQELDDLQNILFKRAQAFQKQNTVIIDKKEDFYEFFTKSEGGFALAHWNGDAAIEAKIKQDLNVTIRCIPRVDHPEAGICLFSGEKSAQRVVFAKSY